MYMSGLMVGTSANTFEPYTTTSRGMIVVMMHNLAGYPPTDGTYFSDVPLNQFYTEAASWAAENGIVSGYGNGSFGPDDPITREQMVMILMRYATYQGLDVSRRANLSQFTDSAMISESAIEAVSWACAEGMLSGSGDNSLNPNGQATRAEVAAIFTRFCQMIEDSENN